VRQTWASSHFLEFDLVDEIRSTIALSANPINRTTGRKPSELESSMSSVQIEQKSYEMPPREGISIAHFLTVADINRSARYYEKVFGARILTMGDGNAASL